MNFTKDSIERQILPNFKGGEKELQTEMYYDGTVRILKNSVLAPGASIGMHKHEGSCEVIYIISGVGTVITLEKEEALYPGDVSYCMEGESHSLVNKGKEDLVFFAVVPNLK